jgi:DNA-binding NarL/FixJ family response regulator
MRPGGLWFTLKVANILSEHVGVRNGKSEPKHRAKESGVKEAQIMGARVLLADAEQKVRAALRLLLENELGVSVVGEATDMNSLLERAGACQPDLVLLDWELPGLSGAKHDDIAEGIGAIGEVEVIPSRTLMPMLTALCPGVRVVALSWQPEAAVSALRAGVHAFVSKVEPPEALLCALSSLGIAGVDVSGT